MTTQNGLLPVFSQGCAFKMADGRQFTDYRPNCSINLSDRRRHGQIPNAYGQTPDSRMYRLWLQRNANTVINENREIAKMQAGLYCVCDPVTQNRIFAANEFGNDPGLFGQYMRM